MLNLYIYIICFYLYVKDCKNRFQMIPESSWIIQNPLPTTIIHYHHLSSSIIHYPPLPSPCITMHHHASPIFTNHIQSSPCITRHETMWIWRLLFYPCGCGTLSFHSWIATHSQTTGSNLCTGCTQLSHISQNNIKQCKAIPLGIWGVGWSQNVEAPNPTPLQNGWRLPTKWLFKCILRKNTSNTIV